MLLALLVMSSSAPRWWAQQQVSKPKPRPTPEASVLLALVMPNREQNLPHRVKRARSQQVTSKQVAMVPRSTQAAKASREATMLAMVPRSRQAAKSS